MHDFPIHGQRLDLSMREKQNRSARSLIHSPTLHSDKAIFHHVNSPNAIPSPKKIKHLHYPKRRKPDSALSVLNQIPGKSQLIQVGLQIRVTECPANTTFKFQFQIFRRIGRVFRRYTQRIHVSHLRGTRINPGILENAAFITDVEKIAIHGIRLLCRGGDWDTVFLCILNHLRATGELLPEAFVPPWRNDANVRSKRCDRQLKAYLIITLTGRAMSDCLRFLRSSYFYHSFRNERAGNAGAEIILIFIQRRSLEHRKDEISSELVAQIVDVTFRRSGPKRLLF